MATTFVAMTQTYRILKELGNHRLRKYIYENIVEAIFDSHRITSRFPQDFRTYYERMLNALASEGNIQDPHFAIANQICLLYTSPSPRDAHESRMPSSA